LKAEGVPKESIYIIATGRLVNTFMPTNAQLWPVHCLHVFLYLPTPQKEHSAGGEISPRGGEQEAKATFNLRREGMRT